MTESLLSDDSHQQDHASPQRDWFLIALLVAQLTLMASTWRLWFGNASFPVIPLFSQLQCVPQIADRLLSTVLTAAVLFWLGAILFARHSRCNRWHSLAACTALISAVALAALNQHRLQPWHWLFILVTAQALLISVPYQNSLRRLTVATIYVFAGLSRLGSDVDTGMVRQLVAVICEKTHLMHLQRNPDTMFGICIVMTTTELLIGFCLLHKSTRKCAMAAAVVMHVLLFSLLSPLGLNHHAGVLIWNAFFAVGIPLLFARTAFFRPEYAEKCDEASSPKSRFAAIVFAASVILFPLSGLFGLADNWPSWQVYSPRPDVVRIYVKASAVQTLPPQVRPFVSAPAALKEWCPVRIDQWSLATVNAPLYPEDRFQLAIANELSSNLKADSMMATIEAAPFLFWKTRVQAELNGTDAIQKRSKECLLNSIAIRH